MQKYCPSVDLSQTISHNLAITMEKYFLHVNTRMISRGKTSDEEDEWAGREKKNPFNMD